MDISAQCELNQENKLLFKHSFALWMLDWCQEINSDRKNFVKV